MEYTVNFFLLHIHVITSWCHVFLFELLALQIKTTKNTTVLPLHIQSNTHILECHALFLMTSSSYHLESKRDYTPSHLLLIKHDLKQAWRGERNRDHIKPYFVPLCNVNFNANEGYLNQGFFCLCDAWNHHDALSIDEWMLYNSDMTVKILKKIIDTLQSLLFQPCIQYSLFFAIVLWNA